MSKTIKIKLKQRRAFRSGENNEFKNVYVIESMTNAVKVDTGGSNHRHVGAEIEEDEAAYLCGSKNTEVSIT